MKRNIMSSKMKYFQRCKQRKVEPKDFLTNTSTYKGDIGKCSYRVGTFIAKIDLKKVSKNLR